MANKRVKMGFFKSMFDDEVFVEDEILKEVDEFENNISEDENTSLGVSKGYTSYDDEDDLDAELELYDDISEDEEDYDDTDESESGAESVNEEALAEPVINASEEDKYELDPDEEVETEDPDEELDEDDKDAEVEDEPDDADSKDADTDDTAADDVASKDTDADDVADDDKYEKETTEVLTSEQYQEDGAEDEDDYYEDSFGETDELIPNFSEVSENEIDEYFDDDDKSKKKRKSSRLDILDDDYIKEDIKRNKNSAKPILYFAWGVFVVCLAFYIFFFFVKKDTAKKTAKTTSGVVLDVPEDANYKLCKNNDINFLISSYLNARVTCNQEQLQQLVIDPEQFDDMTAIESAAKYIKGYEDITCYEAQGYDENSFIIIVLSNLKIQNVDSKPMDIISFYVQKNEDGTYRINNSVLPEAEANYVTELKSTEYIQNIYIHVKENNEKLMETDQTFADFCNMINN